MPEKVMRAVRRGVPCLFLLAALLAATALAQGEEKVVRLRDGTVLRGTLVSSADGVFRVKTRALGQVQVDPGEILSIEGPAGTSAGAVRAGRMQELKSEMLGDPEVMASIQDLARNEEIAAIMEDEGLQAAIMSLDLDYLRRDEKFRAFTQHPDVQAIVQKVKGKGAGDE